MKFYLAAIITCLILVQPTYALHGVKYEIPSAIVTTVGELTTVQINIQNTGNSPQSFGIKLTAAFPNEMEITNPDINTQTLSPGQSTSVSSNIRTLTDTSNPLTIKIYLGLDLLHTESVSVKSKKFSLPEFGLVGFLQIILIAAIVYFLFGHKIIKSKVKKRRK